MRGGKVGMVARIMRDEGSDMLSHSPFIRQGQGTDSARSSIQSLNPVSGTPLPDLYAVSEWTELDAAVANAQAAAKELQTASVDSIAKFFRDLR